MELKQMIRSDAAMREIELALPKHVTKERYTRAVLSALNKNPRLAECKRSSFINAMMDCAEVGLEPNGIDAYFVPYGDQCQFIISYRGLVKLAFQSGEIANIETNVVYANDYFDYETCTHVPHGWRRDTTEPTRGELIGAYAVIQKRDGSYHRERMTKREIEAIRDRSKAGKSGPWRTDFDEMARKTVFRRATKWIQLSPHVEKAMVSDADRFAPLQQPSSVSKTTSVDPAVFMAQLNKASESSDSPPETPDSSSEFRELSDEE